MKNYFRLFSFSLLLVSTVIAGNKWTPEFMIHYQRLGATDISPDGNWVAYELSIPQMEGEKSEFLTHIWLVSQDGKTQFQLTRGDVSSSSPQFSPDGKSLGFLSGRNNEKKKRQIYSISVNGG